MLIAWRVLIFAALWLLFESAISWAAFCGDIHAQNGGYHPAEKYECVLRGPLALSLRSFFQWWGRTFDDAESYIALFTAILAVGTVALWWSTRRLWSVTKIAAEHIPQVERAYVFLWHELKHKRTPNPLGGDILEIQFALRNHGKTPAILRQINPDIRVIDQYPTTFRQIGSDMPPGLVLSADETTAFFPRRQLVQSRDWQDINQGKRLLLFLGTIQYVDIFGDSHETGFCFEWDGSGFSPSPTAALNYHR